MDPKGFKEMFSQAKKIAQQTDAMFQDTGTSWERGSREDKSEDQTHSEAIQLLQASILKILAEPLTMRQLKSLENIHWHTLDNGYGGVTSHIEVRTGAEFNVMLSTALSMPEFRTEAIFGYKKGY